MSSRPTIAVTGASGLLGRPLRAAIESRGRFLFRGSAFRRAGGGLDLVDLTDRAATESWLDDTRASAVVHLAAERRPDAYEADPDAADRLNIDTTAALAESCAHRRVPLLFLSTSYVFDGTAPPYRPDDQPNPLNAYGRSKVRGEQAVRSASDLHRILRVPMLHGPSADLAESSVTLIARTMLDADGPVLLDVRQTRYPAYTPDLAEAVVGLLPGLIDGTLPGPALHFCPDEGFTKQEMGRIMAPLVGLDPARAAADNRPPTGAPRPEDVRLDCPHLKALGLLNTTPFREAIARSLESIRRAGGLP